MGAFPKKGYTYWDFESEQAGDELEARGREESGGSEGAVCGAAVAGYSGAGGGWTKWWRHGTLRSGKLEAKRVWHGRTGLASG